MSQCIVVIEDEVDILESMRAALELHGYDVLGLTHPAEVETLDPGLRPDLFLIDVMLPRVSGIELARDLRRNGFKSTPMIAMSASTLLAGAASAAGVFDDAIDKPFDLSVLLECVELYTTPPLDGVSKPPDPSATAQ